MHTHPDVSNINGQYNAPLKYRNIPDKIHFRIIERLNTLLIAPMRRKYYILRGAEIGKTLLPRIEITWPHQIVIGSGCSFESGIRLNHAGCLSPGPNVFIGSNVFLGKNCEFNIISSVHVGNYCLFASGCKITDVHHEVSNLDIPINIQPCYGIPIFIEDNVWLGANTIVLKGVHIGTGAVVGAGSVVTKSIPSNEIWAGIPARKIGQR